MGEAFADGWSKYMNLFLLCLTHQLARITATKEAVCTVCHCSSTPHTSDAIFTLKTVSQRFVVERKFADFLYVFSKPAAYRQYKASQ
ncbi:unnamed protein product [Protopolystoma xenopodis]|uniref:Secreted protein n=1 Tax=Protopolystoma xenopodis TaxID=117903 RepID=A0A3S5B6Y5_9PLAT|nr:unnamed protein product [Protopolystoma xenopodis]